MLKTAVLDADLREAVIALAIEAGHAILGVYAGEFSVVAKADDSPVTAADLAAHRVIQSGLTALECWPVLSEESAALRWDLRSQWTRYWLVDPLDGTREFVKRNGEFSVNIALIDHGEPVFGVVQAPVLDEVIWGERGQGAFLRHKGQQTILRTRRPAQPPLQVAASRSHRNPRTVRVLERIGDHAPVALGSSLKFCRIAAGDIDVYPRFGPTSEWDTAAGQAVLEAAGGVVLDLHGEPLRYNTKSSLLNPDFIALGDPQLPWREWVQGPPVTPDGPDETM